MKKRLTCTIFSLVFALVFFTQSPAQAKDAAAAFKLWKPAGNVLRLDFNEARQSKKGPIGWLFQGKPFTPETRFTLVKDGIKKVLKVESRKGSGTILLNISKVPLREYPILRWKWKVEQLPKGADGRIPRKDDQVLGIYIGAGRKSSNSLAFRWETVTPTGSRGKAKYGMGLVTVDWVSLRSQRDPLNVWVVEEINLYERLMELFKGKIPSRDLALSVSGNSQYTGSASCGYIAYFEFAPRSSGSEQPN